VSAPTRLFFRGFNMTIKEMFEQAFNKAVEEYQPSEEDAKLDEEIAELKGLLTAIHGFEYIEL